MSHQHAILIVDDDADTRGELGALLSFEHFIVRIAERGREALVAIGADFVPCVVLLDYRMPDADGAASVRELRSAAPGVAIVLVTGDVTAAAHARELAVKAVVLKPIVPPTLRDAIARRWPERRGRTGIAGSPPIAPFRHRLTPDADSIWSAPKGLRQRA